MTHDEIHNIWLHISGKSEGLLEAGSTADFPVMFANAILEYNKRPWVGLTEDEIDDIYMGAGKHDVLRARSIEAKLKEKNT